MKNRISLIAIAILLTTTCFATPSGASANQPKPGSQTQLLRQRSAEHQKSKIMQGARFFDEQMKIEHSANRVLNHYWDDQLNDWEFEYRENFVYDETGRPVEIIAEAMFWDEYEPISKTVMTYHTAGQLFEEISFYFDMDKNEQWTPSMKKSFLYDEHQNPTLEVHASFDNNQWEDYYRFKIDYTYNESGKILTETAHFWSLFLADTWLPSYQLEYTYNEQGHRTSETSFLPDFDQLTFIIDYKEEYFYNDAGVVYKAYGYNFDHLEQEWFLTLKGTDIEWHNFEKWQMTTFTVWLNLGDDWDDWDDDFKKREEIEWFPFLRLSFEYHPELHIQTLMLEEIYSDWDEDWMPIYRERTTFNEFNFKTGLFYEYMEDDWVMSDALVMDGAFSDDGKPLDIQIRMFDEWNDKNWVPVSRKIFEYDTNTSVPQIPQINLMARLFPNPASQQITLEIPNLERAAEIRIFNLSGQMIQYARMEAFVNQHTLNIENLPQGMYMINIQSGNEQQNIKLIRK